MQRMVVVHLDQAHLVGVSGGREPAALVWIDHRVSCAMYQPNGNSRRKAGRWIIVKRGLGKEHRRPLPESPSKEFDGHRATERTAYENIWMKLGERCGLSIDAAIETGGIHLRRNRLKMLGEETRLRTLRTAFETMNELDPDF